MAGKRIAGLAVAAGALFLGVGVPGTAQAQGQATRGDDPHAMYVCDEKLDKVDGDENGISGWVETRYAYEEARLTFRAKGEHLKLVNDSPHSMEGFLKRKSDGKYLGAVYAAAGKTAKKNLDLAEGTKAYLKVIKAPGEWKCYLHGIVT